jgi:hypothetical protein
MCPPLEQHLQAIEPNNANEFLLKAFQPAACGMGSPLIRRKMRPRDTAKPSRCL